MRLFIHPCTDTVMHLLLFTSLKVFSHPLYNMQCDSEKQKKTPLTFRYSGIAIANETFSAIWFCFAYISYDVRAVHTIFSHFVSIGLYVFGYVRASFSFFLSFFLPIFKAHTEVSRVKYATQSFEINTTKVNFSFWRSSMNNCGLLQ